MKLQVATLLILGAVAVHIRDENQTQADLDYEEGYNAGTEAAEEGAEEAEDLSEDFLWGYLDGLTEGLFPGWDYDGSDYAEGDERPQIELPPGVTLNQAYTFCSKPENLQEQNCASLVNYCRV